MFSRALLVHGVVETPGGAPCTGKRSVKGECIAIYFVMVGEMHEGMNLAARQQSLQTKFIQYGVDMKECIEYNGTCSN